MKVMDVEYFYWFLSPKMLSSLQSITSIFHFIFYFPRLMFPSCMSNAEELPHYNTKGFLPVNNFKKQFIHFL